VYHQKSINNLTHSLTPPDSGQDLDPQPTPLTYIATTLTTFTNFTPCFYLPPLQPSLATTTLNLTKPSLNAATYITATAHAIAWLSINSGFNGITCASLTSI